MRVFILQIAQVERAAPGNTHRLGQQPVRVMLAERIKWPQMALAIGKQQMTCLGHCGVVADGSHGVLQGTPATRVHVHIATGHCRNTQRLCQRQQVGQPLLVIRAAVQPDTQPQALGKSLTQPAPAGQTGLSIAVEVRQPEGQQPVRRRLEVFAQQAVFTFSGPAARYRDQFAQRLIACLVFHQQDDFRAVFDVHFTADDQGQTGAF